MDSAFSAAAATFVNTILSSVVQHLKSNPDLLQQEVSQIVTALRSAVGVPTPAPQPALPAPSVGLPAVGLPSGLSMPSALMGGAAPPLNMSGLQTQLMASAPGAVGPNGVSFGAPPKASSAKAHKDKQRWIPIAQYEQEITGGYWGCGYSPIRTNKGMVCAAPSVWSPDSNNIKASRCLVCITKQGELSGKKTTGGSGGVAPSGGVSGYNLPAPNIALPPIAGLGILGAAPPALPSMANGLPIAALAPPPMQLPPMQLPTSGLQLPQAQPASAQVAPAPPATPQMQISVTNVDNVYHVNDPQGVYTNLLLQFLEKGLNGEEYMALLGRLPGANLSGSLESPAELPAEWTASLVEPSAQDSAYLKAVGSVYFNFRAAGNVTALP